MSHSPPHSHSQLVLDTLRGLLAELGNRSLPITMTSDLERDLGLGSLERLELVIRLEQKLAVKLPEGAFLRGQTPAALIEVLAACTDAGGPAGPASSASAPLPPAAGIAPDLAPGSCYIPDSIRTLVDLARYRAEVEGERTHLFLVSDDGPDRQLSFGELWSRGLKTAAGLAERGVEPGDRVAVILPTSAEFFTTFIGILCAGCVPVPLYPPVRLNDLPAYVEREMQILKSAGARVLITDRQLLQVGKLLQDRFPSLIAVSSDELERADASSGVARVTPDDLALIQYSSGSTGDPKGVALSHRSLIANMRAIGVGLSFGPGDIPVSWLPLYHDMGLIGTWLSPFLHGMQVAMMSPLQFLSRPERWLWAFHRYRGSISPAPNFGYDLCVRKIRDEDIQGLDLSSWRSAMNGSEPVRADTVERFCRRFAPYGFRREAMMPVYGLAE
ncbi:MAG TPA: AMP-binding protein, partial [Kofleriaceae bacterium]|nr:AMP-binding protein [Kofleriaceae bacterium]